MVAVVWSVRLALVGRAVLAALVVWVMTPAWRARPGLLAVLAVLAVMAVLPGSAGSMGVVGPVAPVPSGGPVGPAPRWLALVGPAAMAVTAAARVPVPVVRG